MASSQWIEETLKQGLGKLSKDGALVVDTGKHTGRATKERFLIKRPETEKQVHWGTANQPLEQDVAARFLSAMEKNARSKLKYAFQGSVGGFPLTLFTTSPWHVAFAENMFRRPLSASTGAKPAQGIQIFHDPYGKVSELGLSVPTGDTLIVLDPVEKKIGIIGTAYAGEIKKSAFAMCNFHLPDQGILPMHASANCLEDGSESCLLFGLSGTGKTTLSASPDRALIGDDEIVWTPDGLLNLEAGCYAKLIHLSAEKEPEIYQASNRPGSILENVILDPKTLTVDFDSAAKTENTRGSYSLEGYGRIFRQDKPANHPRTIVFLMADAFGAMPAVAKLDPWQTQYHFLSGYTAKVAGTEMGVKEPKATFSTCFGEPFMPRHPQIYARLLAELMKRHGASAWILNTGWIGGYEKGSRFPIAASRALLKAIQDGTLDRCPRHRHPVFGFEVPESCPGVDRRWLVIPEGGVVTELAGQFRKNMERFAGSLDPEVIQRGGPQA